MSIPHRSVPVRAPCGARAPSFTYFVISHTHWDREWYQPFQEFRVRLVRLVDRLLDLLDADPDFRYFMLDGQTVVLEDYLAIRPQREADLRRHIQSGRLLVGPWYVLPDEFLVSAGVAGPQPAPGRPRLPPLRRRHARGLHPRYLRPHQPAAADLPRLRAGLRPPSGAVCRPCPPSSPGRRPTAPRCWP